MKQNGSIGIYPYLPIEIAVTANGFLSIKEYWRGKGEGGEGEVEGEEERRSGEGWVRHGDERDEGEEKDRDGNREDTSGNPQANRCKYNVLFAMTGSWNEL